MPYLSIGQAIRSLPRDERHPVLKKVQPQTHTCWLTGYSPLHKALALFGEVMEVFLRVDLFVLAVLVLASALGVVSVYQCL